MSHNQEMHQLRKEQSNANWQQQLNRKKERVHIRRRINYNHWVTKIKGDPNLIYDIPTQMFKDERFLYRVLQINPLVVMLLSDEQQCDPDILKVAGFWNDEHVDVMYPHRKYDANILQDLY